MTAPNIIGTTSITGKTALLTPSNTSANVLLANSASSGKVYKINTIMVANIDGSLARATTITINTAADGSGTSYAIASTITVPMDATIIIIDKSTSFYLEENQSILVTSDTASKLTYMVSYEVIS